MIVVFNEISSDNDIVAASLIILLTNVGPASFPRPVKIILAGKSLQRVQITLCICNNNGEFDCSVWFDVQLMEQLNFHSNGWSQWMSYSMKRKQSWEIHRGKSSGKQTNDFHVEDVLLILWNWLKNFSKDLISIQNLARLNGIVWIDFQEDVVLPWSLLLLLSLLISREDRRMKTVVEESTSLHRVKFEQLQLLLFVERVMLFDSINFSEYLLFLLVISSK